MTVRSSTRGFPGLPRGRWGSNAFHAASDSQNKLLAMPSASSDSNHGKNISSNQRSVWVLNLERVTIKWNHLIGKDSLKIKELEHVGIEKVERLFRDMLSPDDGGPLAALAG